MTTLKNRPKTALLVIDVQNGVVENGHERDTIVANIASVVDKARSEGIPVVWVQHQADDLVPGSDSWQIVPELVPADDETIVAKEYGDSFEGTELEDVLSGLEAGRVIVTGAQTDQCIRSTLHGAFARGYDTLLVSDAHTTDDMSEYGLPTAELVVAHTNMYWKYQEAPGRTAGTVEAKDVDFSVI